jgi:hypothetical protein
MRFAKIVFRIAGIYGLLVIPPLYFSEGRIGRDTPPPISHPEFFYGFLGVALAWQVAFLIIATDPIRFRPMICPSIVEKVSYGIALLFLHFEHRISGSAFGIGSVDWIFAVLFVMTSVSTRRAARN